MSVCCPRWSSGVCAPYGFWMMCWGCCDTDERCFTLDSISLRLRHSRLSLLIALCYYLSVKKGDGRLGSICPSTWCLVFWCSSPTHTHTHIHTASYFYLCEHFQRHNAYNPYNNSSTQSHRTTHTWSLEERWVKYLFPSNKAATCGVLSNNGCFQRYMTEMVNKQCVHFSTRTQKPNSDQLYYKGQLHEKEWHSSECHSFTSNTLWCWLSTIV